MPDLRPLAIGAVALLAGCDAPVPPVEPVFLAGRAVEPDGDSLFAVTARDPGAVVVYDAAGRIRDTLGIGILHSPDHLQIVGDTWYVSDVADGVPSVVLLDRAGALRRRVPLEGIATQPHQFAVLPDGTIVVEGSAGRLVGIRDDSVSTFAVVEVGTRPSLLLGAGGGVLHAIPDQTITLYNAFGNIRWRVEWPWVESAYISDVGEDSHGRIHLISGVGQSNTFIAYSLTPGTGEVVRWSQEERAASFVVSRLGEISPAEGRWANP